MLAGLLLAARFITCVLISEGNCQISVKKVRELLKPFVFIHNLQVDKEAAGLGFEPRLTDPESVVLPLHHPALQSGAYCNL